MSNLPDVIAEHIGVNPSPEHAAYARAALANHERIAVLDSKIAEDAERFSVLRDHHAPRERWMAAQQRDRMLSKLGLSADPEPGAPVPPLGRQFW